MYYKVQAIREVTIQTSFENNPIPYIHMLVMKHIGFWGNFFKCFYHIGGVLVHLLASISVGCGFESHRGQICFLFFFSRANAQKDFLVGIFIAL